MSKSTNRGVTGRSERPTWHTAAVPGNAVPPPSVYAASSLSPCKKNGPPKVSCGPPPKGVSQKEWDQYMNTINSAQKKMGAKPKKKIVAPTPTSTSTAAIVETTKSATRTHKKVHVPPKPEGTSQAEWNCYLQMVTQAKNISLGLSSDTYVDETNLVTLSTVASKKPREMLSAAQQSKGLSTPAVEFENARLRLKMAEMVKQSELKAKQAQEKEDDDARREPTPLITTTTPASTPSTPLVTTDSTNTTSTSTSTDTTITTSNDTDIGSDSSKPKQNTNPFTGTPTTHIATTDVPPTDDPAAPTPAPTPTNVTTISTTTSNMNANANTNTTDVEEELTSPNSNRGKNASEKRRERNMMKKKQKEALPLQNGATSVDDEWLFGTQSLRLKPWEIPSIEKEKVEVEKCLFPTVEHPVEVEAAAPVAVVFQPTEIALSEVEMQVVELEGDDQLFPGGEGIF
eukprot:m.10141 g.10141  ORF g.10141 m.10141 type:complete len:457 (+) comp8142_c0_seq1:226-1596(+)